LLKEVKAEGSSHRRPLIGHEPKVVTQVVDGVQQQLPKRHQAAFAVDGGALPGVGGRSA